MPKLGYFCLKLHICWIAKFGEDVLNQARPNYYNLKIFITVVMTLNLDLNLSIVNSEIQKDTGHLCQISWKSDLNFLRNNKSTNEQTRVITIPLGAGKEYM